MITVKARYGRDRYKIQSTGHAGTSQTCTAVSSLIQALAGWAQNNNDYISLGKGKATVSFAKNEGAAAVMDMTVIGLLQIQQAVPDDIHVEITCSEKTD